MAVENSNNLDVNLADRIRSAEIRLPSADVNSDLEFFTAVLGFQLEEIFPADDPASILLSGYGLRLRLQQGATEAPGTLRLYCDDFAELASGNLTELCSPSGTRIELVQAVQPLQCPVGDRARRYALPRSYSRPARRIHNRQSHQNTQRRTSTGYGALSYGGFSVDLLLQGLG